ncbi:hypothetical protein [Tenacibaculum ovolyticum]|uniref:hypothetical protein n=1 Tax=Tenacibaculum ovolyticum TaxID=104270 RepID=UPI0007ED6746|nr:hypothetical protein [Tenacibaculum ovolyticum]
MEEIVQLLETILTKTTLETISNSGILSAAKIIAGIGFLIFAYFEGYHQLLGEKFDWKKLGAPIAIIFGIFFYGTFLSITNNVLGVISSSIKSQLNLTENRFYEKLDNYENDNNKVYDEEYESSLKDVSAKTDVDDKLIKEDGNKSFFEGLVQDSAKSLEIGLMNVMFQFFKGIAQIAIMILLIIRAFFLITLSIFGIFSIAFSIYPPLKGSFSTWLQKYVNVFLWLPVSYIMEFILLQVFSTVELGTTDLSSSFSNLILLLISLSSIIGFAMVPVLSGWFLSAATVSAASKLKGKSKNIGDGAKKLGKKLARKAVTGGL